MKQYYLQCKTLLLFFILNSLGICISHAELITNPFPFVLDGTVVLATCGVVATEEKKYVDLGVNSTSVLSEIGNKSNSQIISFNLMNCPPNNRVSIKFIGNRDTENSDLLAINSGANTAKNIAIELQDINKSRVRLGFKNHYTTDQDGKLSTNFYAHYIVTKKSALPGKANSQATFEIEYE